MKLSISILLLALTQLANAQVIDDFESYNTTAELQNAWRFADGLDLAPPYNGGGTKSLLRESLSVNNGSGLIVLRDFASLDLSSATALHVWFWTDPVGVSPLRGSVSIHDAIGNACATGQVVLGAGWTELMLDLSASCGTLDLSDISRITIGCNNFSGGTGHLRCEIDDITTNGAVPAELIEFVIE